MSSFDTPNANSMLWPALTVLGGLLVYFLLFRFLVDPLTATAMGAGPGDVTFQWEMPTPPAAQAMLADDLMARYLIGIPTVLLTLGFIAVTVIAFTVVLPRFGRVGLLVGLAVLPLGATLGVLEQYNNPVRSHVANCMPGSGQTGCPLNLAAERGGGAFSAESLDHVLRLISWNSGVSVAAIALLAICFVYLARVTLPDAAAPARIRNRLRMLTVTTGVAAVILACAVATTHGFYHLSPALMAPDDAKAVTALASAGALYWGAVYSTVMVVIALPAVVSVARDAQNAAEALGPDGHADRQRWMQDQGIRLRLRDAVGAAVATMAPILTSPVLDALHPWMVG